jgi:hypothetical protein
MPLLERCLSVRNYRAVSVAPTQKDQPLLSSKSDPISQHISGLGTNKNFDMGPDGAWNKNDCAGEGQQQYTGPLWWKFQTLIIYIFIMYYISS